MIARSYLYVPGDRPERFAKALHCGAHAVILDLEDAVALRSKDVARSLVAELLLSGTSPEIEKWVRINSGERGLDDLWTLCSTAALAGIFLPKANADWLGEALSVIGATVRICPLIESALGVLQMSAIASHERVDRLALGEVDLVADLGMASSADGEPLGPIRLGLVVASAAWECLPPIGPVWTDTRDDAGFEAFIERLRLTGFGACQAIHPRQVPTINRMMSPTTEEIEYAKRVMELAEQSDVATFLDDEGKMIDEAVLRSARRLLDS